MEKKKKRRRHTRKRRIIVLRLKIAATVLVLLGAIGFFLYKSPLREILQNGLQIHSGEEQNAEQENAEGGQNPAELILKTEQGVQSSGKELNAAGLDLKETAIYTFTQGPKAWNSKTPWSGAWCEEQLAGSRFSVFGCGLCDLANIYSTLTSYDCSPIDMYYYAQEVSSYSPGGGFGAIDWPEMADTLAATGFTCELHTKDETFEEFCEQIDRSMAAIVLVSSYADSSYWPDTEGHYVNIWSYKKETQEVFLGDSGDPSHNRSWIPLQTVYSALKTWGSYQYMLVTSYNESANTWRHTGIDADWIVPDYYRVKETAD